MPVVYVPTNLPRDTALLSRDKWNSIRGHLTRQQEEEARRQKLREAAQHRQTVSKQMKDDWPNTLAKLHAKRLQDREDRLRKKEEDQLAIDAEEAKIQAVLRKQKLDAAREMLFHNEERVRNLDGALLLSEVLKERDEQVALKAEMKKREDERERQWQKHLHFDWARQAEIEAQQQRDRRAAMQRSNAKEIEVAFAVKEEAKKKELEYAEQVREATRQYEHELQLEKEEEYEKRQQMKKEANEYARTQRAFELLKQKREEEENAETRIYSLGKLEMARQIKQTRDEILDRSRRRSEVACALLERQLMAKQSDEDARIAAAVAEKRAKDDALEAEKAAARADMVETIRQHRSAELRRHREQQEEADRQRHQERRLQDERTAAMASELRDRHRDLIDQRARNRRDWREQVDETEAKRLVEKEEEYAEVRALKCTQRKEQKQFDEYVRSELERLEKGGRNTFPLRVAARASAPGFLRHSTDWSSEGIRPY
ncbi:coiled-coil domain-containing protein 173-like [Amphibalanus amphitrite]|uniref:coiled-coil domain-containing protein 173-like n=1 Tax=Amphibalanus amphitrite TaxID=1232801 RepID=UPI001C900046|nr:coiled-coil domain-containing protein 173-like [Amphibalanus amphitrite]